jgi:hypothetical protein
MDYTIASSLKNALLEHREFSEFHSISPADSAISVIHEAGLSTAFVPLAKNTRKDCREWHMHLAIVNRRNRPHNSIALSSDAGNPSLVYALTTLRPMSDYVGELSDCCLTRLWWAAPDFFYSIASIIAPGWRAHSCNDGGRSGWGAQDRAAMDKAFTDFWTPESSIQPTVAIPVKRLRFTHITTLPLDPATAGDDQ